MSSTNQTVASFLYRLVTPTTTVTQAGASTSANKLFNTNIPITMAMLIRQIRVIQAFKQGWNPAGITDQFLWELTEDATKTAVSQTDAFALADGGYEFSGTQISAVGEVWTARELIVREFNFLPPHPGVPTVAQQLNLVATSIRVVGADTMITDTFLELYYELINVSDSIRTFLSNRIALQRTT